MNLSIFVAFSGRLRFIPSVRCCPRPSLYERRRRWLLTMFRANFSSIQNDFTIFLIECSGFRRMRQRILFMFSGVQVVAGRPLLGVSPIPSTPAKCWITRQTNIFGPFSRSAFKKRKTLFPKTLAQTLIQFCWEPLRVLIFYQEIDWVLYQ